MRLNPFHIWERRQKLRQAALEEAHYLRRRHEGEALAVAEEKQQSRDLTLWGRSVLKEAIKLLRGGQV